MRTLGLSILQPFNLLLRMMPQSKQCLANALRDLIDGPVTIDLRKPVAMLAIVLDYRGGLLLESAHALMEHLNGVIRALDKRSSIEVTDSVVLRWF